MLLFFYITISLIIFIAFLIIFAELKFKLSNFEYSSINKIQSDFKCEIGLYFLGKIKILNIKIDNKKLNHIKNKKLIKTNLNKITNNNKTSISAIKLVIKIIIRKIKVDKLWLVINLDTKSVIKTSYLVAVVSSIIPNILRNNINNYSKNKYYFSIHPLYKMQNYFYAKVDCIISLKIVHIINMYKIYKKTIHKKCKGGINYERTSNRRINVNCNGKH